MKFTLKLTPQEVEAIIAERLIENLRGIGGGVSPDKVAINVTEASAEVSYNDSYGASFDGYTVTLEVEPLEAI